MTHIKICKDKIVVHYFYYIKNIKIYLVKEFTSKTGWNLDTITYEVGHIVESATGKVLSIVNGSTADGKQAHNWTYNNGGLD